MSCWLLIDDHTHADWFQQNARAYLEVCDLFGQAAAQHHDGLVKRFIEGAGGQSRASKAWRGSQPADRRCRSCCAHSRVLRDLRLAADRRDIATRHDDLARLRRAVGK